MKVLRISRSTLHRHAREGLIRRRKIGKRYDYLDEDVYRLLNHGLPRKTYIYARASTPKQKKALENQIFTLLDEVMDYKVDKVIIAHKHKDRLSRVGFSFFDRLFKRFGTEIVAVSEVGNKKLDAEEIFEEIVSLLRCYSMKLYSKRRNKRLEVGLVEGSKD